MPEIFSVKLLTFLLVYPLIWLLSILPFRVLYLISDIAYFFIYYIIGYRKKTVIGNLKIAFPEKSDDEIKHLSKKFYKHFTDIFAEMVKSFTISKQQIMKRYTFKNIEVIHHLQDQGKSAILLGFHYANWEWIFNLNLQIKYTGFAIYKRIRNKYFDKKVRETRGRYNTILVPTKEIFSVIKENKQKKVLALYGFLGDQSPKPKKLHYWNDFFYTYVPIHTGVETLAKKHDLPIVFFTVKKIKRGYYEATFELLTDAPSSYKDYELTDKYLQKVEAHIKAAPEYYFWTHKRFKHKDKAI